MSEPLPIQQVAKTSGLSSRTLRHYDEIGLLKPVRTGSGGHRLYGRQELLRLQQILLMRQLALPLPAIKDVLDEHIGQIEALRLHRSHLAKERKRLARLEKTIDQTIIDIQGEQQMDAEQLFDGFDNEKQQAYEKEIVDRFGSEARSHIDESWRNISQMTKKKADEIAAELPRINADVATLMKDSVPADDARTQALIAEHYGLICKFWTPNAEQYAGLGQMYGADPRFRADYDLIDTRLVEYFRDAMETYASRNLT